MILSQHKNKKHILSLLAWVCLLIGASTVPVSAVTTTNPSGGGGSSSQTSYTLDNVQTTHQCGSGKDAVKTAINFGCVGETCNTAQPNVAFCGANHSAIMDMLFAIIRFLSYGVGLIVIASLAYAGIQYATSQGDPQATAKAETRIRSTIIALLIYIFGYAILNYIIPKGFLR